MTAGIKLTHEIVKQAFEAAGCELLETEYQNAKTKMKYRCKCNKLSEITYDNFRSGNRCKACGSRKGADKLKLSHQEVAEYFKSQGCELLDQYQSNLQTIRYRCKCGVEATTTWNNFKTKNRRCWDCGLKNRSGKNHYEWRGDKSRMLIEYRYRQTAYRTFRAVDQTPDLIVSNCKMHFGYDIEELEKHITSFDAWDEVKNKDWEIDHIYPVWAFLESGVTDIRVINSLDNLQVLPKIKNRKKAYKFNPVEFVRFLVRKGILHASSSDGI